MKLFVKIFDFFLNSSVWVAIAVCALTEITCLNFELETPVNLLEFVFFGTILGYNFIKYFENKQLSVLHLNLTRINLIAVSKRFYSLKTQVKLMFFMSVLSAIVCGVKILNLTEESLLLLVIPIILTFFYAISFNKITLRSVTGIKIYIVGIVWALIAVLLPVLEAKIAPNYDVWLTFVQRVIFVVVLILPFDIRDLKVDRDELGTLPQKIGVKKTKLFGAVLLVFFYLLEFFKNSILEINLIVLPIVVVATFLLLINSSEKQSKYYASFFVESIPLFWLLLLLIL